MVGTTTNLRLPPTAHSELIRPPEIPTTSRGFLASALLGVALGSFELFNPSSILCAQEPVQKETTESADSALVVERSALLQKIATLAASTIPSSRIDSTVQKIETIRPLVAEYRRLLNGPNPPDLQELTHARTVVFTPLNTIHFSAHVPSQHARPFFQECVIELYSDLSKHLRRVASESPIHTQVVADELDKIFKDTLYIAHHHDTELCAQAVAIIEHHFLTKEDGAFARTYRTISARPQVLIAPHEELHS